MCLKLVIIVIAVVVLEATIDIYVFCKYLMLVFKLKKGESNEVFFIRILLRVVFVCYLFVAVCVEGL